MSESYDKYLKEHIHAVNEAYEWLKKYFGEKYGLDQYYSVEDHDGSKRSPEEYLGYDRYFYGKTKSQSVVDDFNKAWLHHIHNNPHHWQYWVLLEDDPEGRNYICIEMPIQYVFEMIADWWSFSWRKGDLSEIFDWYTNHREIMKLNSNTRKLVDSILNDIRQTIS